MRLGGRVTLIVLVLAAGPSLGQAAETGWTQGRGDAGRSGIALLPGTPLDVVGTFNMLDADQALNVAGDGLAWTPWGIVGVEQPNLPNPTSTCRLFRFDLDTGVTTRVTEIPCPEGARLGGYDPVNDIAIVCVDGTPDDLLVRAFDSRSGAEAWGARPEISLAEARGVADQNEWACQSPAIDSDAGVAYVAFGNEQIGRHVIQAVSLVDGSTLWASTMPATAFTGSSSPMPPTTLGAVSGQVQGFNVDGVTLTDTGLVLFGRAGARTLAPAYAWMGLDGTPVGAVLPYSGDFARAAAARLPTGQSGLASASGDRAAALLTGELVFINPLSTDPEVIPIPDAPLFGTAPLAWSDETIAIPLATSVVLYDTRAPDEPSRWAGDQGGSVLAVVLAPPGDAYVVTSRGTPNGVSVTLTRIDMATTRSVQQVPIPSIFDCCPRVLGVPDGLVLFEIGQVGGRIVHLSKTDDSLRPTIAVGSDFPAAGEPFTLTIAASRRASVAVAWGDGVVERVEPGAVATHSYDEPGRMVLRATALYPDNRTATSEHVLFVGATPPQELTFMQRAFAPENQNTTYAIAGLSLTLLGAAIAAADRKRRRGRVGREIHELHRIRDLAARDMPAALRELHAFHSRIELDHAHGALDDGQFGALELREQRLRETLRNRVLGPVAGRVTPRFLRALDAAFEDGVLDPGEARDLREALRTELNLDEDDRVRLAALFETWATGTGARVRTGAPGPPSAGVRTGAPSDVDDFAREGRA